MAGNTSPIFSRIGAISGGGPISAAMASPNQYNGVDGNVTLVFTADATNGSYVQRLRFKSTGTTVATVARIFLNNGSVPTSAANNDFYGEISLPATSASQTQATSDIDYALNLALPAGWRIYVGLGTDPGTDGWFVTCIAGNY